MTFEQLVFYTFSFMAIVSALMMILSKNAVRSVLYLVFTFFCMAGIWMLLESEFLAIVLVLVYVGAVMVLFLFVVMMLDMEAPLMRESLVKHWPIGAVVASITIALLIMSLNKQQFGLEEATAYVPHASDYSHVKALGTLLYTDYLLPFEIAGILLLVAMVAAIGLTFRGPRDTKTQKPSLQTQVRKENRLRIVKMATSKENEDSYAPNKESQP
ncbi:MAG: NADH-quinone oxidoreductase subunit J [Proteobacteria bacterium]|nr:NADH-quinone oxidoreductase subunit J [Pseudomonadota bacterium]